MLVQAHTWSEPGSSSSGSKVDSEHARRHALRRPQAPTHKAPPSRTSGPWAPPQLPCLLPAVSMESVCENSYGHLLGASQLRLLWCPPSAATHLDARGIHSSMCLCIKREGVGRLLTTCPLVFLRLR